MTNILLSLIAGLLLMHLVITYNVAQKSIDILSEDNTNSFIAFLILALVTGAIFFGITYELNNFLIQFGLTL